MKKKQTLFYSKGSETIRQAPENYLIAKKDQNRWVTDPDLACNQKFATKIFKALFIFDNVYGSGENLLKSAGFKNEPQLRGMRDIQEWERKNGKKYSERNA
jgi:hypothetical protein